MHCDMAGGGWTRIVNVLGTTPQNQYAGVTGAVGSGASGAAFYKLADSAINMLADGHNVFRVQCGAKERLVSRTSGWTSERNQGGWEMDRDLDFTPDCGADRTGYVFADYPPQPLYDGADCRIADHMDYGESTGQTGCYSQGQGWGNALEVWWHPGVAGVRVWGQQALFIRN